MAFLRTALISDALPAIRGARVTLRPPQMSDYLDWCDLRERSRAHLTPWEPAWARDELTRWAFRRRLRHYHREQRDGTGYGFLLLESHSGRLIGGLTLANIRRGVTQSATLGYWLGAPFVRCGYMSEAVAVLVPFVFDRLRLNRLEAYTMTTNTASIGVLERNGFQPEGIARRAIKINGTWQDHRVFALLADDPRPEFGVFSRATTVRPADVFVATPSGEATDLSGVVTSEAVLP